MVFINKGAGNFPKSSPKRVLLYLDRKNKQTNLNDRCKETKTRKGERIVAKTYLQSQKCAESVPYKYKEECF